LVIITFHKDYKDKHRHKEDDLDLLPIGKLSRNSAIFRKESDDGVFARNLVLGKVDFIYSKFR
jgi:hypothetical protein